MNSTKNAYKAALRMITNRVKTANYNPRNIDSIIDQARQKTAELAALMDVASQITINGVEVGDMPFQRKLKAFENDIKTVRQLVAGVIPQIDKLDRAPVSTRKEENGFNNMKKTV